VFKERRLSVRRQDGSPVDVKPLLTMVDPYVSNVYFSMLACERNNEVFFALRGNNMTSVAIRLLDIMFMPLQNNFASRMERCKICDGWKVVSFNEGRHRQMGSQDLILKV